MIADVLIVGGGPAGAAAALTIARYSRLRAVIVDREQPGGLRPGETIGPAVMPLLQYLGVRDRFDVTSHTPAFSTLASWEHSGLVPRDSAFTGYGVGWHLDRTMFDQMLIDAAEAAGATVVRDTTCVRCERADAGLWRVHLRTARPRAPRSSEPSILQTRFLIDASGRAALVSRSFGQGVTYDDRLISSTAMFRGAGIFPGATLIEASPEGWWYSAPLSGGRVVVSLITDAECFRALELKRYERWSAALERTTYMRRRVEDRPGLIGMTVRPIDSRLARGGDEAGWLSAGDASATFDPISGMGIGYAIASGIHAARAAEAWLAGNKTLCESSRATAAVTFSDYAARRRELYRRVTRWPASGFWRRRYRGRGEDDDPKQRPGPNSASSQSHGRHSSGSAGLGGLDVGTLIAQRVSDD